MRMLLREVYRAWRKVGHRVQNIGKVVVGR
jgi:hypothetical protein